MSYSIETTDLFVKQIKRLRKKYASLAKDLQDFQEKLLEDPFMGVQLGDNMFKVRVAIKSKGKGKSGGLRIITFVVVTEETIFLLTAYDKSEIASVKTHILRGYANAIMKELEKDEVENEDDSKEES